MSEVSIWVSGIPSATSHSFMARRSSLLNLLAIRLAAASSSIKCIGGRGINAVKSTHIDPGWEESALSR